MRSIPGVMGWEHMAFREKEQPREFIMGKEAVTWEHI